ncbi:MAG: CAP domain-containing protein [Candidatus Saccharimonadales bacterium]
MTLQKTKPKRPTSQTRKRVGQHHPHSRHFIKTYWPYLPIITIIGLGFLVNNIWSSNHSVLGYATDVSVQDLLNDTNQQRQANSESSLALNSQLSNAAQTKANDMSSRNYWSHNTPDGATPWTFVLAAGYNYQLAGENLAYGFATSADTLTGWMNSPEHRANILNAGYKDVGFGIVNIPNYQNNGPETLVVAMYGSQANQTIAVTPAATSPTPPAATKDTPLAAFSPTSQAVEGTETAPAENSSQTNDNSPSPAVVTPSVIEKSEPVAPASQERISRIQLVSNGNAPWSLFVISLVGVASFIFVFLRHGLAWHKMIVRGESFVLHHPMLDIIAVALITVGVILSRTAGVTQ